jgi:TetR/AcrR family transcriptional regulator, transcriptional repressor for nem operon
MVKVSRQQAAENRARILTEASRLFRERGLGGVGVDALTEAAGLTHGSLYSRFGSKERLAAEALADALARSAEALPPRDAATSAPGAALEALVSRYLSTRHRDAPGGGCALAALCSEVPRQGPAVRAAFTEGVQSFAARLAAMIEQDESGAARDDEAFHVLSSLVGALVLARAVDDPALSSRILEATRLRLSDRTTSPG